MVNEYSYNISKKQLISNIFIQNNIYNIRNVNKKVYVIPLNLREDIFNIMKKVKDDIDCNISDCIKYDSKKNLKLNDHHKSLVKNNLCNKYCIYKDKLFFKPKFIKEIKEHIKCWEKYQNNEEDPMDELNNIINITNKTTFNTFFSKLENIDPIEFKPESDIIIDKRLNYIKNNREIGADMNLPKKFKVSIDDEFQGDYREKLRFEYITNFYAVKSVETFTQTQINCMPKQTYVFTSPCGNVKNNIIVPVPELLKNNVASIKCFMYRCVIIFEDGNEDDNLEYVFFIKSLVKLERGLQYVYGYLRPNSCRNDSYLYILNSSHITPDKYDITQFEDNKNTFYQLINYLIKYISDCGYIINKKQSDILIFMETIKLIYQFGGFDKHKICHSMYVGLRDVGKSYITKIFSELKFPDVTIPTPNTISEPGLFGASNRTIDLPDYNSTKTTIKGALSRDCIILEEAGEALFSEDPKIKLIMGGIKQALSTDEIYINKVSGADTMKKLPRTAYFNMIMNYTTEVRKQKKNEFTKYIKEKIIEHNKYRINDDGDVIDIDSEQVSFNVQRLLLEDIDILSNSNDIKEEDLKKDDRIINKYNIKFFKKTLNDFKESYISDGKDISTNLDLSVKKRFMFSVNGYYDETKIELDDNKLDNNFDIEKPKKPLYKHNLKYMIKEMCFNRYEKLDNLKKNKITKIFNILYKNIEIKYPKINKIAEKTFKVKFLEVGLSIMMINKEFDIPSIETINILEKWIYLQCSNVSNEDVRDYKKLDKKIDYYYDKEYNYKEFKEMCVKL